MKMTYLHFFFVFGHLDVDLIVAKEQRPPLFLDLLQFLLKDHSLIPDLFLYALPLVDVSTL